jgi:hypothetical protein
MAKKFRTTGPDVMQPVSKPKTKPGALPDNQIPIFDHRGNMRGRCGLGMSSAGVSRFTGTLSNRLGRKDGRPAWIAAAPKGPNKTAAAQSAKLAKSLKAAKGSNP